MKWYVYRCQSVTLVPTNTQTQKLAVLLDFAALLHLSAMNGWECLGIPYIHRHASKYMATVLHSYSLLLLLLLLHS